MRQWLWLALWLAIIGPWAAAMGAELRATQPPLRITVVYNNVPHAPGLATAWGFAAVIAAGDNTVLFDTGGDGPTLLANLRKLGIIRIRSMRWCCRISTATTPVGLMIFSRKFQGHGVPAAVVPGCVRARRRAPRGAR